MYSEIIKKSFHSCFKCHVYFWDRKKMKRHLNRVPHAYRPAERLLCQICSKTFSNDQSLANHLKYIHTDKDRQFECYLCRKALKTSLSLAAHLRLLHVSFKKGKMWNILQFQCRNQFFLTNRHFSRIADEKNVCAICGRICSSAGALYSHMYSHNPADTVCCDICQKT